MGGPTGRTKQRIILALYEASESGKHITATDLVGPCGVKLNTISEHITELRERAGYIRECADFRGWLELTQLGRAYARSLQPRAEGIAFRGVIAAGPAAPIEEINEMIAVPEFDPATHFALRVRGTSMVGFGILDGDMVIFRKVESWKDVPDGKIVAARVPEGTGIDGDNWLDHLATTVSEFDDNTPPLDHVTLKQFNARFRSYCHDGVQQRRAAPTLRGSNGVFRPLAIAIDGVMVHLMRDYD